MLLKFTAEQAERNSLKFNFIYTVDMKIGSTLKTHIITADMKEQFQYHHARESAALLRERGGAGKKWNAKIRQK